MDCRVTLNKHENFLELLNNASRKGEKAFLLIDDNGMTRMEGFVSQIITTEKSAVIVLDQHIKIQLDKIIAVNGTFLPEYGEC